MDGHPLSSWNIYISGTKGVFLCFYLCYTGECLKMYEEEGKWAAFLGCLPTTWQVPQGGACRYLEKGGKE